eukprot:TRINITY_DN11249_c0_g1_i1.p1 TRINITY_DN11249_c0_g1~~TRINITY_DN11249_c0_g1_i1.p1  ORF type:complete len:347 (-),score=24.67 TRINITY_DN11249_c0_g1_i1:75-1115(-)
MSNDYIHIAFIILYALCLTYCQAFSQADKISTTVQLRNETEEILKRDCVKTNFCRCISLGESDCFCGVWKGNLTNFAVYGLCVGRCSLICKEIWTPRYDIPKQNCPIPKLTRHSVAIFTSSKSMIGSNIINSWKEVLETFWDQVDFEILYLGKRDSGPWGYTTFGSLSMEQKTLEIEGDVWQLCAMKKYRDYSVFMPFLYCLNLNYLAIPHNVENCSKTHGLNYTVLQKCFSGPEGKSLLKNSVDVSIKYQIRDVSVFIDGLIVKSNPQFQPRNYINLLCKAFGSTRRYFPWWVVAFLGGVILALIVVVFIVKQTRTEHFRNFFSRLVVNSEVNINDNLQHILQLE